MGAEPRRRDVLWGRGKAFISLIICHQGARAPAKEYMREGLTEGGGVSLKEGERLTRYSNSFLKRGKTEERRRKEGRKRTGLSGTN